MSKQSPQELFPNLFAAKAAKAPSPDMKPQDMRLLQYCMRQAAKTRPGAPLSNARRPMAARPAR